MQSCILAGQSADCFGLGRMVALIGGGVRKFARRWGGRDAHPPGTAHLQRHLLELARMLLERIGHLGKRCGRDPIVGARREVAQLVGPLPLILRPVKRVRHAPETGRRSGMFRARVSCEICSDYSRRRLSGLSLSGLNGSLGEWRPRQETLGRHQGPQFSWMFWLASSLGLYQRYVPFAIGCVAEDDFDPLGGAIRPRMEGLE